MNRSAVDLTRFEPYGGSSYKVMKLKREGDTVRIVAVSCPDQDHGVVVSEAGSCHHVRPELTFGVARPRAPQDSTGKGNRGGVLHLPV